MVSHSSKHNSYHSGKRSIYRHRMESQHETNMNVIMDSLRVIRNQVAVLRIYLPAIFTFTVLTLFLTLFLHHLQNPTSVFIIDKIGLRSNPDSNSSQDGLDRSLVENFNGYMSYSDLVTKRSYMKNKQMCEYGSIWQTTQYLQGNMSVGVAADADTRTLDLMGMPNLPFAPNYRSPCFYQKLPGQDMTLRCLPYFFLAGFPKCGTTDLYKRMEHHPLIAAPNEKEPLWFSRDRVIPKRLGIKTSFTKYMTKFSKATETAQSKARRVSVTDDLGNPQNSLGYHPVLIGDFSTRELFNERTAWELSKPMNAELFRHIMPCVKFVVLMRDPVERLYSDYIYFLKREPDHISPNHFHKRVMQSIRWWKECVSKFPIPKCLFGSPKEMSPVHTGLCFDCWQGNKICPNIRIGLYYSIIQEWLKFFPRESFLFLRTEDYNDNELEVINKQVFPFLGIPPLGEETAKDVANMERQFPAKNEDVREKFQVEPMHKETKQVLTEFYRSENENLAKFMNDNRYLWEE